MHELDAYTLTWVDLKTAHKLAHPLLDAPTSGPPCYTLKPDFLPLIQQQQREEKKKSKLALI